MSKYKSWEEVEEGDCGKDYMDEFGHVIEKGLLGDFPEWIDEIASVDDSYDESTKVVKVSLEDKDYPGYYDPVYVYGEDGFRCEKGCENNFDKEDDFNWWSSKHYDDNLDGEDFAKIYESVLR